MGTRRPRALRRAGGAAEPAGRGAGRRRSRARLPRRSGSRPTRTTRARRSARRWGTSSAGSSRRSAGEPVFFCAHLDTVPPEAAIEPVVGEDEIVRNGAGTILGADDKSAVAAMLEATGAARRGRPAAFRASSCSSRRRRRSACSARPRSTSRGSRPGSATSTTTPAPIGEIILGAPHQQKLDVRFHGRAAHAGHVPRGGPLRDRGRRARDRRPAAGPARRGDLGERRPDPGRHGAQRHPRMVRRSRRRRAATTSASSPT